MPADRLVECMTQRVSQTTRKKKEIKIIINAKNYS
jgi:hypothetical protein